MNASFRQLAGVLLGTGIALAPQQVRSEDKTANVAQAVLGLFTYSESVNRLDGSIGVASYSFSIPFPDAAACTTGFKALNKAGRDLAEGICLDPANGQVSDAMNKVTPSTPNPAVPAAKVPKVVGLFDYYHSEISWALAVRTATYSFTLPFNDFAGCFESYRTLKKAGRDLDKGYCFNPTTAETRLAPQ